MNYDAAAVTDRGEWMKRGTVWIICVEEIVDAFDPELERRRWVPRQDLPPTFDERIAKAYAKEQTYLSERAHEARAFHPTKAST